MLSEQNSRKIGVMGFVSSIMVVFIHIPKADANAIAMSVERFLGSGVCYMAVPFFFLVAGFLLARHSQESDWWQSAIRKRLKSLMVPYLVWCVVAYLIHVLVSLPMVLLANHIQHQPILRNIEMVFPSLILAFGLNPMEGPSCVPLWFLRTLFLLVIVSPILAALVRRRAIAIICLLLVFMIQLTVGAVVTESNCWHDFFYYFLSFQGVFYFSLGFCLERHRLLHVSQRTGWFIVVVALFLVGFKTAGCIGSFAMGPWMSSALNESSIALLLIGCWAVVPPVQLGVCKYSFPIYVLHPVVINMFAPVGLLFPAMRQSVAYYFVFGFLVIGLSILIAKLLKSRCRSFACIAFGGR